MRKLLFILTFLGLGASGCALADASPSRGGDGVIPAPESWFPVEAAVFASAEQQLGGRAIEARLWVDGDRDLFQRGDRFRLQFRTSRDAHVAVLHIAPDGELDFLFPSGPRDNNLVRGLRTYSLPGSERNPFWSVGSRAGMGYFFIVASAEPLDFRPFQFGSRWDLSSVGSQVRGDPFWLLEQITMMLVPGWRHTPYAMDYYSYHVGQRSPYPSFVCYDGLGWRDRIGWNAYYGSCDRILLLLRSHPHYYDSRRFRGDRRVYWQQLEAPQPRHGFKEPVDLPARRPVPAQLRGEPAARPQPAPARTEPERPQERRAEPARPERQRPTLERRPPERTPERQPERQPERTRERPSEPAPQRARERPAEPAPERQAPQRPPRRNPPPPPPEGGDEPSAREFTTSERSADRSAASILRRPGG